MVVRSSDILSKSQDRLNFKALYVPPTMSANVESGRHASLIAAVEILVKEALAAKSAADQTVAALAKMYETTAASVKSENGLR